MLAFGTSAAITIFHRQLKTNSVLRQTHAGACALSSHRPPPTHCDALPPLPNSMKMMLDAYLPNWRFPDIGEEECETVKQFSGPQAHPEWIQGDFNDDGRTDYAALIEQDAEANDRSVVVAMKFYIVAFFRKNHGYRMQIVTDEGGSSLLLMRKGQRDYNYEAQSEFTYARDTIFSGFGMGGTSYLYENGRFRAIITSD